METLYSLSCGCLSYCTVYRTTHCRLSFSWNTGWTTCSQLNIESLTHSLIKSMILNWNGSADLQHYSVICTLRFQWLTPKARSQHACWTCLSCVFVLQTGTCTDARQTPRPRGDARWDGPHSDRHPGDCSAPAGAVETEAPQVLQCESAAVNSRACVLSRCCSLPCDH